MLNAFSIAIAYSFSDSLVIDIMPFVSDNILKIFEICKTVHAFLRRQVLARYPKLINLADSSLANVVSILVS